MLNIVYSNNTQNLASHLAQQVLKAPLSPFEQETILVQSNKLSRWLTLFLAQQHGIAANLVFPFPSAYIWSVFRQLWPDIPLDSPYSKSALVWRIYALLPRYSDVAGFESVSTYLGETNEPLKRYQLAERLADNFDQYLMFRPDWIRQWEKGQTDNWQSQLWYALTEHDTEPKHRAYLLEKLHDKLKNSNTPPEGLPQRLHLFGLTALPPVYLQTFTLLARYIDITIYTLSPSEYYWGELIETKQHHRVALQQSPDAVPYEPDHPLLASLGKQGMTFFRQLQEIEHQSISYFEPPESGQMLAELQADMYWLTVAEKSPVIETDDSIMVHSCHSPMREMEVLYDQLLAMFERDPDLSPADIVVMTPDIGVYAPWIEAVFGSAKGDQFIPFSITDYQSQSESQLIQTFLSLLQLPSSRLDVEMVLSALACPAVQKQFLLDETAIEWVRTWCRHTHIRWGFDQQDKQRLNLPATDANTWRAGLNRLMLGFAMPLTVPNQPVRLFDGELGLDGIQGEKATVAAALCAFIEKLNLWREVLDKPQTILDWHSHLNHCLDTFFDTSGRDEQQLDAELMAVRKQLDKLLESADQASFADEVGIELMHSWLSSHLEELNGAERFMGYGVTFCGMVPVRSIPFDVVCLVGMNDADFPRRQPGLSFDLLTQDHREGDRSRREDDRYLFLEAILSAKKRLYLSYVGASIVDNNDIPPSVLLSDFQDFLSMRFETQSGGDILDQIKTKHPLQPFSYRYFDGMDDKLFSFNASQCPPQIVSPKADWFASPLPEAEESWRHISVDQLARFFAHPAKFLLRERLHIQLQPDEQVLETREPFQLDGLSSWQLRQELLEVNLASAPVAAYRDIVRAKGVLPHGYIGDAWFDQEVDKVMDFSERLEQLRSESVAFTLPFEFCVERFQLEGQLEAVTEQGLLRYRLAKLKGKDVMAAWLDHLVLNHLHPEGIALETRLITEDNMLHFLPVNNVTPVLNKLLDYYWQGCHQPLKFFDKASLAYFRGVIAGKGDAAIEQARKVWSSGNLHVTSEQDDPYYQLLYPDSPLDDLFTEIAEQIYQDIVSHLQGGKL
ncbi:Exodeoxyribonuclease V gamma chain [Methylophaga frappieri]|uniref:RecBCD enzyme subunit RecC n=1 Tax=Methylophaga frappieri (strain ATCC BAA-2434 / DSM 25690 / JAM7) TaxID=754477 RepID=I1YH96_METFJ|nr:exodeoxyribonuclease V subunit gamma [Methylophaga frappieri]AFJ02289.1 Exodeoxyribonuclease V gamma chain [Methylophaga frappieri]